MFFFKTDFSLFSFSRNISFLTGYIVDWIQFIINIVYFVIFVPCNIVHIVIKMFKTHDRKNVQ